MQATTVLANLTKFRQITHHAYYVHHFSDGFGKIGNFGEISSNSSNPSYHPACLLCSPHGWRIWRSWRNWRFWRDFVKSVKPLCLVCSPLGWSISPNWRFLAIFWRDFLKSVIPPCLLCWPLRKLHICIASFYKREFVGRSFLLKWQQHWLLYIYGDWWKKGLLIKRIPIILPRFKKREFVIPSFKSPISLQINGSNIEFAFAKSAA